MDISVDLDSARMSGSERLRVWQSVMSTSGAVEIDNPDEFIGSLASRSLVNLRTMRVSAASFRLTRDAMHSDKIARDQVLVNLIEDGWMRGRIAGNQVDAGPGSLVISRLTNIMDLRLCDATWLALLIPQPVIDRHMHWNPAHDGRVFAPSSAPGILLSGLLRSLDRTGEVSVRDLSTIEQASLLLLSTALRAAPRSRRKHGRMNGTARQLVYRLIDRHLTNPELSVTMISEILLISRSELYRSMAGDADIAGLIRKRRLEAIARDIVNPAEAHVPLAAIAARWGMRDPRAFGRAFVRHYGYPPSSLRRGEVSQTTAEPMLKGFLDWFSKS